ncbi:antibiotic biosynthesis monooxygenase [Paraglaciecola aquimarina]|uniref:Antibiotic biosynthesis monooxygenase n=1 Tax=Paraglaciecola algarum TaxID=3050085 RepID=A0ABS9DB03_9ALTE|nr:putative quinol monooxygenase [Paraglaciecola sp. G1-23]MCF2950135.1 antibiotic biosynthesis monooxygenase [Paraglaciecola sp. G1-23]
MYLVTVKFDVKPERLNEFLPLMLKQAEDSISLEENCLQFDVSADENKSSLIFLYEIYQDKQDFSAHLDSQHFKTFAQNVTDMVLDKKVECFDTLKTSFD